MQIENCWCHTDESVQCVVSSHSKVEACFADVSLHPMNRLAGSSTEQIGIEQLDDVWKLQLEKETCKDDCIVFFFFILLWFIWNMQHNKCQEISEISSVIKTSYLPK